jgi:predicted nucleic acid-binding protein
MNGLRVLTKVPVVADAMVLLRMLADKSPYAEVLNVIREKCNKIVFSTSIRREWATKAYAEGMSAAIVIRKLEELNQINKLKKSNKTSIDKARRLISTKKCGKPSDTDDLKYIEVALAEKAIIITRDHVLLDLNPYRCGQVNLEIRTPENYLSLQKPLDANTP